MKCCEQYAAALSAFVDGELSENEKEEVLSHVEHCQNCREYLSELMIVHTMFEEMPELDAPEGFSERVLERVHEEKRARSLHRRAWPRVLAACFALFVITAAAWKLAPAMGSRSASGVFRRNRQLRFRLSAADMFHLARGKVFRYRTVTGHFLRDLIGRFQFPHRQSPSFP